MKIHHFTADEALQSLHSTADGLSSTEAHRRLLEFGPNRVETRQRESLFRKFLQGFSHFFACILWIAAALAFWAAVHDPDAGMATLGCAIVGVILVNGLFSFWQEYRAEKAMAVLQTLLPHQVKALRDGTLMQLPAEVLVPGDVILLEEGDDIPADSRLLEAFGVRVNNATITGESLPQARDA
jgi:magnesium-transporting ATPase (P-type)